MVNVPQEKECLDQQPVTGHYYHLFLPALPIMAVRRLDGGSPSPAVPMLTPFVVDSSVSVKLKLSPALALIELRPNTARRL